MEGSEVDPFYLEQRHHRGGTEGHLQCIGVAVGAQK